MAAERKKHHGLLIGYCWEILAETRVMPYMDTAVWIAWYLGVKNCVLQPKQAAANGISVCVQFVPLFG